MDVEAIVWFVFLNFNWVGRRNFMKKNIATQGSKKTSNLKTSRSFCLLRFEHLLICLGFFLGTADSCFSQGTVAFQNSVLFETVDPTGGGRRVYDVGSPVDIAT